MIINHVVSSSMGNLFSCCVEEEVIKGISEELKQQAADLWTLISSGDGNLEEMIAIIGKFKHI